MIHTEVLQQYPHVDVVEKRLETGYICKTEKKTVVCFLLGKSQASEFYMPTFRNTLFHLHRRVGMKNSSYPPAYEDVTVFQNVGI